ncbi:hypothetical protein I3F58_22925 [Streptomyces sp. MUM 203J]|uniref:hypothetical protein n=1 Tax=Streptomyces sp. MUM 203J TaxID=2791990 RepID=UPI001F03AB5B|nr:hypothetical protein [Streptomyces sp. MUM 203J]MCH0542352.1 hypothetical protein [Streptomyces sp. MUM 203J]
MNTERVTSSPRYAKFKEVMDARLALASALRKAGIQLPALDIRVTGRADDPGYGVVELGICAAPVAQQLAEVITRGAEPR